MFPYSLNRSQYLVRLLLLIVGIGLIGALTIPALSHSRGELGMAGLLPLLALLLIIPFRIAALDVPRIRSIGWSPWLLLLLLVPGVNGIFQILLFVMPPRDE
ncbi:MAG TPA: DUF805 domain-containing protein [Rhizobium sp.]|nr:DUF805 domain-containing protein [Rhizobium sp.]